MHDRPLTKRERQARRLLKDAPKRVCKNKNCSTVLSAYNDDSMCNRCYEAIPINMRPYQYRSL